MTVALPPTTKFRHEVVLLAAIGLILTFLGWQVVGGEQLSAILTPREAGTISGAYGPQLWLRGDLSAGVEIVPDAPWTALVIVYGGVEQELPPSTAIAIRAIAAVFPIYAALAEPPDPDGLILSRSETARLRSYFAALPATVADWSKGRADLRLTVAFAPEPLAMNTMVETGHGMGPDASSVRTQIDALSVPGQYDSIFAVWPNRGSYGAMAVSYAGLAWPSRDIPSDAWFSTLKLHSDGARWSADSIASLFVHEWSHQVERVNRAAGLEMLPLHEAAGHGYTKTRSWLRAWLDGTINPGIGFDPRP